MAYLFLVLLEAAAAEETDVDARSSKAEAHCADDVESPAVCRLFSAPFGAAVGEMVTLVSAGQQSGWLAGWLVVARAPVRTSARSISSTSHGKNIYRVWAWRVRFFSSRPPTNLST